MKYRDLRDFMAGLEKAGELIHVREPVVRLEMTALSDRILRSGASPSFHDPINDKALQSTGSGQPVWYPWRVAMGMGADDVSELRDIGRVLASLKEPEPPKGLKDAASCSRWPGVLWDMKPATLCSGACQDVVREGSEVDLTDLPIQWCWPEDAAPAADLGTGRYPRAARRAQRPPPPEPGHLPPATVMGDANSSCAG